MKLLIMCLVATTGCGLTTLEMSPVKVEPIHMTIDVNVHDAPDKPSDEAGTRRR